MVYTQWSNNAQTGGPESSFQRINQNPNSTIDSEAAYYPTKFDVFVNKENSNLGGYTVVENHNPNEIIGSVLYLNHRIAIGSTGEYDIPVLSDGDINTGLINVFDSSLTFSTVPTANFTVSYTARGDQVHDSHLNALQNSHMSLMDTLGLKAKIDGYGTGLLSEKPCVAFDPTTLGEYEVFDVKVPSAEILPHLKASLKIGGTDNASFPGYGSSGITNLYLGASGTTRNDIYIDTDNLRIAAREGVQAGEYIYGMNTGDANIFTGRVDMASQLTVGFQGGALINPLVTSVPAFGTGTFYSGAAIRAHGGIWFGSGLSGYGDITFIPGTGSNVDIEGALECDTLTVLGASDFYGQSTWYQGGGIYVNHPGNIATNQDVTLDDKPGALGPSHIDTLDPSYAKYVIENPPALPGSVTYSVRPAKDVDQTGQYTPINSKLHPVWGYEMYPMMGGWTYTGICKYNVAKAVPDHPNILLLETRLHCIGRQRSGSWDDYRNLGQGGNGIGNRDGFFGHYSSGLFEPGDTFVEIKDIGAGSDYSFPIYHHEAFVQNPGNANATLTGINLYINADDDEFNGINLAGKQYRIYQPGNAPFNHLVGWLGASASPTVTFGNNTTADYPNAHVAVASNMPWLGGASVTTYDAKFKRAQSTTTTVVQSALRKNIHWNTYEANYAGNFATTTGVAYIYAIHKEGYFTNENELALKASPSPFGIQAANWTQNPSSTVGISRPGNEVPVGEVWATTVDGNTWTHLETTSYRVDGYYDSCWVPLVKYQWDYDVDANPGVSTVDQVWKDQEREIGRCLPFYGSNVDAGGQLNQDDVYENDEDSPDGTADSYDIEKFQFFVEHNLGPVKTASDIKMDVWIGSYAYGVNGGGDYVRHPIGAEMNNIAATGVSGSIWQGASTYLSIWGNYSLPYNANHSFHLDEFQNANRGYLKDISKLCTVRALDSRFALVSVTGVAEFRGPNGDYASYIRVIMNKTR